MEVLIAIIVIGVVAYFIFTSMNKPSQSELIAFRDEVRSLYTVKPGDSINLTKFKNMNYEEYDKGLTGIINGTFKITRSEFDANKDGPRGGLEEYIEIHKKVIDSSLAALESLLKVKEANNDLIATLRAHDKINDEEDDVLDSLEKMQEKNEIAIAKYVQALSDYGYEYKL